MLSPIIPMIAIQRIEANLAGRADDDVAVARVEERRGHAREGFHGIFAAGNHSKNGPNSRSGSRNNSRVELDLMFNSRKNSRDDSNSMSGSRKNSRN